MTPKLPDPFQPGERLKARDAQRQADAAWGVSKLVAVPPLYVGRSSHGQILSVDPNSLAAAPIWALLSGTTSPYSFTELLRTTSHTWVTRAGGLTGSASAYEENSLGGLGGKVVLLYPSGFANDYTFTFAQKHLIPPPPCYICITVIGCNGHKISGATVTIKQGATTIGTCTTTSTGVCCVLVPASGTYSYTVSAGGFVGVIGNVTVSCPGTTSLSIGMTPDAFHICTNCCNGKPLPESITATDQNGTHTLHQDPPGFCQWRGHYVLTAYGQILTGAPPTTSCDEALSVIGWAEITVQPTGEAPDGTYLPHCEASITYSCHCRSNDQACRDHAGNTTYGCWGQSPFEPPVPKIWLGDRLTAAVWPNDRYSGIGRGVYFYSGTISNFCIGTPVSGTLTGGGGWHVGDVPGFMADPLDLNDYFGTTVTLGP